MTITNVLEYIDSGIGSPWNAVSIWGTRGGFVLHIFFQVGFSSEQSWNRKVSTPSIDNSLIPPLTLQSTSESGLLLAIGIWNIWKRNENYGLHDMMFTFRTKSRRSTWYDVYVSKIYMIRRNETQKYLGPMTIISIIIGCVCLDLIRGFQLP